MGKQNQNANVQGGGARPQWAKSFETQLQTIMGKERSILPKRVLTSGGAGTESHIEIPLLRD